MVVFSALELRNFKRYAGEHNFPLYNDAQMTVIAAQNGIGKIHGTRTVSSGIPTRTQVPQLD